MADSNLLQNITGTILLAGAGKMGGAMLTGWLSGGLDPRRVAVIDPYLSPEITALAARGVMLNPDVTTAGQVETMVVAVKPQMFREAGAKLKSFVSEKTSVVSIMAGTTIAALQEVCGGAVVRAMPNTPA
ncbi:NAD(P)-binding domain-containing protein, partial [Bradyrhizobium sp. PRIMUS42]